MAKCEVCGNDYHLAFEVIVAGRSRVFDSFECAIHSPAPICSHCDCRIVGHGVEADTKFYCCAFYCCAHCARAAAGQEGRPPPSVTA